MADTRDVRVRVVRQSSTPRKPSNPKPPSNNAIDVAVDDSEQEDGGNGRFFKYVVGQAVGQSKSNATYFLNKYISLTENYMAGNSVAMASAVISRAKSTFGMVTTGASIGGWVGALVGGGLSIGQAVVDIYKNKIDANQDLDQKAYDKYHFGQRYGLVNGSRGTEN